MYIGSFYNITNLNGQKSMLFGLHPRKLDGSYITCIVRDLNSFSSSAIEPLGGATIVD